MIGFGIAAALVLAVSLIAFRMEPHRFAPAAGVSLMLLFTWWATIALIGLYGEPDGARLYPVVDVAGLGVMLACWAGKPRVWKVAVMAGFVAMLCAHFAYWAQAPNLAFSGYSRILDWAYAAQLVAVLVPGGGYVASAVIRYLSDRRGSHSGVGAR